MEVITVAQTRLPCGSVSKTVSKNRCLKESIGTKKVRNNTPLASISGQLALPEKVST